MPGRLAICPAQEKSRKPIQLHCKLFTNALGDVFKTLDWNGQGINVNGQYLLHLRFADDIVILTESLHDLKEMLNSLDDPSKRVGQGMVSNKLK